MGKIDADDDGVAGGGVVGDPQGYYRWYFPFLAFHEDFLFRSNFRYYVP
jgi:hypothetical protein